MEFHQKAFMQAVALACAVAIGMTGCERSPAAGTSVGTEIDDTVVTAKVKSALLADPNVKSFDIKVETRKGQVQLSGYVGSQSRIDKAIALTRKVEGVKSVQNGMSLKRGKTSVGNKIDDGVVTAKVKSALLADAGVKGSDISVVTRKGKVQLSGYVDDQTQINRAINITRGVEGVQRVGNEMSIKK